MSLAAKAARDGLDGDRQVLNLFFIFVLYEKLSSPVLTSSRSFLDAVMLYPFL